MVAEVKKYKVIGTRPIRHDGLDKVTGRAIYGADLKLPDMLAGAVLRSVHAHARLKRVDTSRAEQLEGVYAVMTNADLPPPEDRMIDLGEGDVNFRWASHNIMAPIGGKVLYKGHPIAAVAASDRYVAERAIKLIKVEYEVLEPVTDVKSALKPNAPILLEEMMGDDLGKSLKNTNIATHFRHEFGDLAQGFAQCKHIVENEYTLQMVHQGYIEPHNATALWDEDNRVKIWTSTQGAFPVRRQVAGILRLKDSAVRVFPLEIGGGFGGKIQVYLEPLAAILSRKAGHRPIKMVMDRPAVFESTGPAPGGVVKVKIGADANGKLLAAEADIKLEAGAYPGSAVGAAAVCIYAPYDIPNTRIDGWDVVVNKPKSAAYRAPGSPQAAFPMETAVDELCQLGGWNPLQFRLDNASREGTRRGDGVRFPRIGNIEVLESIKKSPHWKSPKSAPENGGRVGRGIASGYWMNIGLRSVVTLSANQDGVVSLVEGSTDIGGTRASISMQAAEVLNIPAEDIRPLVVDTESIGYTDVTGGSRTTYATGYAAVEAAKAMVVELKQRAARLWELSDDVNVRFEDGIFYDTANNQNRLSFKEVCAQLDETGGPVSVTGLANLKTGGGAFSTHIADVEVDPETGKTDILRYTIAQDAGTAIHPSYVEGQMQGGVVQGIGWALNEEYYMSAKGTMLNASFLDYRMPTALDIPPIETIIVEVPNPLHPYGVRGVGEVPICPPVPTVANAIADALGVRLFDTPMKPSKIVTALENAR